MTCYLRDGTKARNALPCNNTAIVEGKHTSCCDQNDNCFTNGLCRAPEANELSNFAWFFGCTDKTFKDPSCGTYCDKFNKGNNNHLMYQCPQEGEWCCNTGANPPPADRYNRTNTTCCTIKELLFKAPGPTVYTRAIYSGTPFSVATLLSPSTAASLSRYSSGTPAVTSAQSTETSNGPVDAGLATFPAKSPPKSPALGIGLGAGLGAFVAVALILGIFFIWRRKSKDQGHPNELPNDDRIELTGQDIVEITDGKERYESRSDSRCEMMADVYRAELPSDTKEVSRSELPGERRGNG